MIFLEFSASLFDAMLCVYFISHFNGVSLSPVKNRMLIPSVAVIFVFSIINDIFLSGFNLLGTLIFLSLYIGYACLICHGKYVRAIISGCIFEITFVLLSSVLYLVITFIIKDYDALVQGSNHIFRYAYIFSHKILLFVILRLVLWFSVSQNVTEIKHGAIAFLFSCITVLGLASTMDLASVARDKEIQAQTLIIAIAFTLTNVILYFLIFQVQKYQRNKYEVEILRQKIAFEHSRHSDASAIWASIQHIRHDINQHFSIILGYLEDGKIEECREYIGQISGATARLGGLISSGNTILDYIINSKLGALSDTEIVISGSIGDLSDIRDIDLTALIGNILDNAIEALARLKKATGKRLELLFMRQNSNRIIICKNTAERSVLEENPELQSSKENARSHGYGTKIIAKIASDYNGMVDFFEEFGMFGVQVILPEP